MLESARLLLSGSALDTLAEWSNVLKSFQSRTFNLVLVNTLLVWKRSGVLLRVSQRAVPGSKRH